jgi:hypothetical protein
VTYRKVVSQNYMAHKEVYGVLRHILLTEASSQFAFLDIACGTAAASVEAERHQRRGAMLASTFRGHRSTWVRKGSSS